MGCQTACLRLTIVITDFVLWLIGIAILAVGSFLKLSNYIQYTLDPTSSKLVKVTTETDIQFNNFSWLLIAIGLLEGMTWFCLRFVSGHSGLLDVWFLGF